MEPSDRPLDQPHLERLGPDQPAREEILAAHRAALLVGDAGYVDPVTGLFVFTAQELLDQGDCCDRRCRHCPFA